MRENDRDPWEHGSFDVWESLPSGIPVTFPGTFPRKNHFHSVNWSERFLFLANKRFFCLILIYF